MELLSIIAFILNLIIIYCEIYTLRKIKEKLNILKYYTFLQNFLALIISIVFVIYLIVNIFFDWTIPETIKGLRYVATCGLTATMFIYVVFLARNEKNKMCEKDFLKGFNPKIANFILHYFCPIVSLISFIFFERQIDLSTDIWTAIVPFPSVLYWVIYLILTANKIWKEPYDFSSGKDQKENKLKEVLTMIIISVSFVVISFILWNIK